MKIISVITFTCFLLLLICSCDIDSTTHSFTISNLSDDIVAIEYQSLEMNSVQLDSLESGGSHSLDYIHEKGEKSWITSKTFVNYFEVFKINNEDVSNISIGKGEKSVDYFWNEKYLYYTIEIER